MARETQTLRGYLPRFSKARVLVVGDLMVDHYLWGTVARISPEAPVPVVDVASESLRLGGAANVLNNLLSLGGQGAVCGVIGADEMGQKILADLKEHGVETDGVVVERGRVTTKKTRIIAHSQQVVRFDREHAVAISRDSRRRILDVIRRRSPSLDALVISDYAKGVITPGLIAAIMTLAREHGLQVVVDPKLANFRHYQEVTVVTPNTHEAAAAAGIAPTDDAAVERCGRALLKQLNCRAVLITRGEHGVSLFERAGATVHIPAQAKEVFDVTGAGDTLVGALALALAAGAPMRDSAALANYAAGVVVGIVGTATVTREALRKVLP